MNPMPKPNKNMSGNDRKNDGIELPLPANTVNIAETTPKISPATMPRNNAGNMALESFLTTTLPCGCALISFHLLLIILRRKKDFGRQGAALHRLHHRNTTASRPFMGIICRRVARALYASLKRP